jgi:hypothetical protein
LLANAECQALNLCLIYRFREQARSHILVGARLYKVFAEAGLIIRVSPRFFSANCSELWIT